MFLKFRYRLGYESLCREVADSITWRRFCRIPLGRPVPHPTTLMKMTTRCGDDAVDGLNEALLAKAAAGEAAAHRQGPGRHHRGAGQRGLSDRLGAAGQGGRRDRRAPWRGSRPPAARPAPGSRDRRALGGPAGALDRREAAAARRSQQRDEAQAAVRRITGELAGDRRDAADAARPASGDCATPDRALRARDAAQPRRAGCTGRSTTWTTARGDAPSGSWRRPGSGWPG